MRDSPILLALAVSAVLTGCGNDSIGDGAGSEGGSGPNGAGGATKAGAGVTNGGVGAATGDDSTEGGDAVTYWEHLRPLIDHHCMGCHHEGGIAPAGYELSTPEQVEALAPAIIAAVAAGRMPPWQLSGDCADFQGSLAMTPEEIDVFSRWMNGGQARGDEGKYAPREPKIADIGADRLVADETFDAVPGAPYTPNSSLADDFRCFVIDPAFETTRYMTGFETIVDNVSILHHIVAFKVPGDAQTTTELDELLAEDDDPGYRCFGSARTGQQQVVAAWAPGGGVTGVPEGTAIKFDPGDRIVLQMHFNVESGSGPDQSSMRFWFLPEGQRPAQEGMLTFVGNLPFQVSAGANGLDADSCETVYTLAEDDFKPPASGVPADAGTEQVGANGCVRQDIYYRSPVPLTLWGTFPHMHLTGRDIKIEVMEVDESGAATVPMEETAQCLVETHAWDFEWQRAYWYSQPKTIPADGLIRLTCKYDNRTSDEPVQLGEGSGDEMCLGLLYLSF